MSSETSSICLKNVYKSFGESEILHNITLEVECGSIFGLLGPSGCGKTTAVKIMAGISQATRGEVFVLNQKMPNLNLMNQIGYMAQSDALYDVLTARENLNFFATLYGMKPKETSDRIKEVMALVNLTEHMEKPVNAFSGGMKRRLSLAMALIHSPAILILDEPTVGIDPLLRKDIWNELYKLASQGITIMVTTHVMDEADKCHKLAMMREGSILAMGTPSHLIKQIGACHIEEAFMRYSSEKTKDYNVEKESK